MIFFCRQLQQQQYVHPASPTRSMRESIRDGVSLLNEPPAIFDDATRAEAAERVLAEANKLEVDESGTTQDFDDWQLKAREMVTTCTTLNCPLRAVCDPETLCLSFR